MAQIENPVAAYASIRSSAEQVLTGKKAVSRIFVKHALDCGLITTSTVSAETGVSESEARWSVLRAMSDRKIRPLVVAIRNEAKRRCSVT